MIFLLKEFICICIDEYKFYTHIYVCVLSETVLHITNIYIDYCLQNTPVTILLLDSQ